MGEGDQGRRRETGRLGTLVDSGFPFGLKAAKTTPRGACKCCLRTRFNHLIEQQNWLDQPPKA
jgi:hypothetical protein